MAIVFGRVGLRKILLFLVLLGSFSELQAQKKSGSLRELNEIICHKLGGDFEKKYNFLLNGKGKVKIDCITGVYAIEMTREVGYANTLYYACLRHIISFNSLMLYSLKLPNKTQK